MAENGPRPGNARPALYAHGAVRYEEGKRWVVVNPREQRYSTALFRATEYWDGHEWSMIYDK